MAKENKRYVQFYTPGSTAVKVAVQDEQTWAPLPEPKPRKKIAIYVDPVAALGCIVAVCMLVLMAVGINQLNTARREVVTLERYVAQLTAENHALEETYSASYNPDVVYQQALDLGMIPVEDVTERHIYVTLPQVETAAETTLWNRVGMFLTGLFA